VDQELKTTCATSHYEICRYVPVAEFSWMR